MGDKSVESTTTQSFQHKALNYRWLYCRKCGKRLIKRLPNGMFHFRFGRSKDRSTGGFEGRSPVNMVISGMVKIRCFDESCGHTNVFSPFDKR